MSVWEDEQVLAMVVGMVVGMVVQYCECAQCHWTTDWKLIKMTKSYISYILLHPPKRKHTESNHFHWTALQPKKSKGIWFRLPGKNENTGISQTCPISSSI